MNVQRFGTSAHAAVPTANNDMTHDITLSLPTRSPTGP